MTPSRDVCSVHNMMVEGFNQQFKNLCEKVDKILEKISERGEEASSLSVEVCQIKKDILRVERVNEKQWKAIDGLWKYLYIGMGIAIALSIVIPVVLDIVLK